jgi:hypothetical protein
LDSLIRKPMTPRPLFRCPPQNLPQPETSWGLEMSGVVKMLLIQLFIKLVNALVASIVTVNDPLSYFLITMELNN